MNCAFFFAAFNVIVSTKVDVTVATEEVTETLKVGAVELVNNFTNPDKITIEGLAAKDIVTIYSDETMKTVIGKATVSKAGAISISISISGGFKTEKVYITVKSTNLKVSEALEVEVPEVPKTTLPGSSSTEGGDGTEDETA